MSDIKDAKYRQIGKPWNPGKIQNFILIGISLLFIVALGVKLLLNISRVEFIAEPPSLFPDGRSTSTIRAVPYNAVGFKVHFKSIRVFYEIEMGQEKVDIISRGSKSITLRAKYEPGEVILRARVGGDAIPYEIIVPILPQFAYY